MNDSQPPDDEAGLARLAAAKQRLLTQLETRIVGQQGVIEQVLIALVAGGHCLLVGVPGLAKTLLVHSLAEALDLSFHRIQFTPDLMPSDITGTEVIQEDRATGERQFRFIPGPVFANIVLADEINRTPPKTQAALLEAMQEGQVTAAGQRHAVPQPFFVLATQNPIEQEGTYPLPEAQLDRFMFDIRVDYMDEDDELAVVMRTTTDTHGEIEAVINGEELVALMQTVRRMPIAEPVARYATRLARATRPGQALSSEAIDRFVQWGAGPRASQYLVLGAKARAALEGRPLVERRDIEAVARPVLRHRIRLTFAARAEGMTPDRVIDDLVASMSQQEKNSADDRVLEKVFRSADAE
jgi:MoxR-like ATPase